MTTQIHFTPKSTNRKLGPIPATTLGRGSCPDDCAFLKNGCYGDDFFTSMHWNKVSSGERDMGLPTVAAAIRTLPESQVWRHAVTGDITKDGKHVDADLVGELAFANAGRPVIAYTHADMAIGDNHIILLKAGKQGFQFNLSANNLAHADELAVYGMQRVVALPKDAPRRLHTPAGTPVVTCPATYREDVTCSSCKLCARARDVIVGFPAHGTSWKKIDVIARRA